jgi:plasmid stabilization system protein ParE
MEYRIKIAAKAYSDAEEAHAWIAQHAPANAAKWYLKLFEAIDSLKSLPFRCSLAPESDAFQEEIRQFLFGKRRGTYRVLFTIRGDTVQVLRIMHGARQFLTPEDEPEEQ